MSYTRTETKTGEQTELEKKENVEHVDSRRRSP